MNTATAKNIREHRTRLGWTQQELADLVGIDVRTVQRAERGELVEATTLQWIAQAFRIPLELLCFDVDEAIAKELGVSKEEVTPELVAEHMKQLKKKYATVTLTHVKAPSDLAVLFEADGAVFECQSEDDGARDLAAELEQWLSDLADLGAGSDAVQRRDWEKQVFAVTERLDALGFAVLVGVWCHGIRAGDGPVMPWRTLYVIVAPKERAAKVAIVEKTQRLSFH
jgi:transcriptional regulator with XRE-family HTH domain